MSDIEYKKEHEGTSTTAYPVGEPPEPTLVHAGDDEFGESPYGGTRPMGQ